MIEIKLMIFVSNKYTFIFSKYSFGTIQIDIY